MIRFDTDQGRFNFRSVAVIIHNNHLLIHRVVTDDFWALPGGRVEFFETSCETVVREINEELGLTSEVERHLWQVENFFECDAVRYHELANYFLVTLSTPPLIEAEIDFQGIETSVDLLFRWVPLNKLSHYKLMPSFLIEKVNDLPNSIESITFNELTA